MDGQSSCMHSRAATVVAWGCSLPRTLESSCCAAPQAAASVPNCAAQPNCCSCWTARAGAACHSLASYFTDK